MKKILVHNEREVQKRRDTFEERFRFFNGHQFSLEEIKKKVNSELEVKYLKGYFGKEPNPVHHLTEGKFSFSKQGLQKALVKNGADLKSFKMEVGPETVKEVNTRMPHYYSLKPFLDLYSKRKDVFTQTCQLTYKGIQMEIIRWFIKNSPFGLYEIIPTKEMPCNPKLLMLREDEFYMLDLPTLLMDLALELELREEEITYHAKQMRIATMETSVLDEDCIPFTPIDNTAIENIIKECEGKGLDKEQTFQVIVQPWMDSIYDYLVQMTNKYKDAFFICNLHIEPRENGGWTILYGRNAKTTLGTPPQAPFIKLCKEKQVEGDFTISESKHLSEPTGRQTVAWFKVEDSEMIIDEAIYDTATQKDRLIVFPNAKDRRFQLQIHGSIGINALVGYLKQMPELCRKMNKYAESLNF